MGILRASLRLLYLLATIALVPVCLLYVVTASLFGPATRHRAIMAATPIFGRVYLLAFGIVLHFEGRRDPAAKLFVANHVSYLDIFIVAAATGAVFVSRHDVKHWPLFGWFARMAGTVFIDRSSIRSAIESSRGIVERVGEGARITLFPEGGILPGEGVKPFRPFLLATAAEARLAVQPLAIRYTHIDGHPIGTEELGLVEWHDTPLHTHAWRLLKRRRIDVAVRFGTASVARTTGSEGARAFAAELREAVAEGAGAGAAR